MEKHKEKEEQQKDLIFDIFLKCQNAACSDRRQVHFSQLCEQVFKWHKDYFSGSVDNVGVEIVSAIIRITKDEKIASIPKDRVEFFRYLSTVLKNEKAAYYRQYESGTIHIPKEQKSKLKAAEDLIRMQESNLGRKLIEDERSQCISKWFKNQEYLTIEKAVTIGSLSVCIDEDGERDHLNSPAVSLTAGNSSNDPLYEYIFNERKKEIIDAVQFLLDKKQKRSRPCYQSLFTLHCIEELKDFEFLYPVLDHKILKTWHKDGKKPRQFEVYQKYHPNASRNSAEARASEMAHEFLDNLKAYFKDKAH